MTRLRRDVALTSGKVGLAAFVLLKVTGADTGGSLAVASAIGAYSVMVLHLWRQARGNRLQELCVLSWSASILFAVAWLTCAGAASLTVLSCDVHGDPSACRLQRALSVGAAVAATFGVISTLAFLALCAYAFIKRRTRFNSG